MWLVWQMVWSCFSGTATESWFSGGATKTLAEGRAWGDESHCFPRVVQFFLCPKATHVETSRGLHTTRQPSMTQTPQIPAATRRKTESPPSSEECFYAGELSAGTQMPILRAAVPVCCFTISRSLQSPCLAVCSVSEAVTH